jgi:hypothetical protein
MAKKKTKKWIQKAIKRPGALRAKAAREGALHNGIDINWLKRKAAEGNTTTARQARLALTLRKLRKRKKRG